MEKQRYDWVDVARTFGMFLIYLGHFSADAGYSCAFVYAYHVPLFFFLSGCLECLNAQRRIHTNILKKAKSILIPYVFFSTISIFLYAIQYNVPSDEVLSKFVVVLQGSVRNTFFIYQLWFFTCLFVVYVLFEFIKKLKYKFLMILACLLLFLTAEILLPVSPVQTPSWFFNIDSALYYIIYFCLGYVTFPSINKALSSHTKIAQFLLPISTAITLAYAVGLFYQHDLLARLCSIPYMMIVIPIIRALILIWLHIMLSNLCKSIRILCVIGRRSLYLFGSEYIIKSLVPCIAGILGLQITIANPLSAMIYSALLILLVSKFLVPVESRCIAALNSAFNE